MALAGAEAVRVCGGPSVRLPIGRPTAPAARSDPPGRLPSERVSAAELKANFAAKGFGVQELVVLSGAWREEAGGGVATLAFQTAVQCM